jgi:hypothetical protein
LLVKIDFLARKFKYASVGVIPQFIEALSAVLTFTFYTKVSFVVDNYIVALKAHNFLKDTFYFFASRVPCCRYRPPCFEYIMFAGIFRIL